MSQPPTYSYLPVISFGDSDPPPESRPLGVRSFGMIKLRLVRESNEDQFLIAVPTKAQGFQQSSLSCALTPLRDNQGYFFVVADGIGGSPAGKEASGLAVKSIEEFLVNTLKWFFQIHGLETEKVAAESRNAIWQADARMLGEVAQHPEYERLGTTLTLAYSLGVNPFAANAGDSQCYLFRHGKLTQLTCDHSLAYDMVRPGLIQQNDRRRRILGHLITNSIGGPTSGVWTDVLSAILEAGDVLLLATDGLTNYVLSEQIAATLETEPDPKNAREQRIAQALELGGPDDVTVIGAHYEAITG